jgi:two-component system response regulator FixJ
MSADGSLAALPPCVDVIDDDEAFRLALCDLLRACRVPVRGHASAQAYLATLPSGPGCLLLDVHMPQQSGLDLQAELMARGLRRPILFLTGAGDIPMTVRALKAGAEDFLTKPVDRHVLLAAIDRAFARDAAQRAAAVAHAALQARFARLTRREAEVCQHLVAGSLNKQVAYALGTTERTIKAHRQQIMSKLAVHSTAELSTLYERLQRGGD